MGRLDFWKRHYGEDTTLDRALKRAGKNRPLSVTIKTLYFNPDESSEGIAGIINSTLGVNTTNEPTVASFIRPEAKMIIDQERSKIKEKAPLKDEPISGAVPHEVTANSSVDELEKEAVGIVMNAHSGVTLNARMKKVIIFIFKTFAPLCVLLLTIPESYWVFTHIYAGAFARDQVLPILTGVFAVLVDFGYLYLTVLLELNKEAMFKRRRSGQEVETHETKAVQLQSVLWWIIATMDILAQLLFLYSATHDSTFFDQRLVLALVCVRVFSLFITMFVVSFAGTELMTDVDTVANEQVERADKVGRVLAALGTARKKQMEARIVLEQMVADQDFKREGERFLKELYQDAREEARRQREANRHKSDGAKRL
jgi:hypothetical protein